MSNSYIMVLITAPDMVVAKNIAKSLLADKLCACVNLVPGAISIYEWDNKINETSEILMFVKTTDNNYLKLEQKVKSLHPYDIMEIIKLNIDGGEGRYLDWVYKSTS